MILPDARYFERVMSGVRRHVYALAMIVSCVGGVASGQEYYYDSYQVTNQHRFFEEKVGGSWGYHLGHMVRTATQGLWYVDDTGVTVGVNPTINYHWFDGTKWVLKKTLANPSTIQQNTATVAVGDTIYTYGVNTWEGYIEEAVCDTRTSSASYHRRIRSIGWGDLNYIGAAVSPGGTRVVWWTRVVTPKGPSDWVYMYNDGSGWSSSIVSKIAGDDFSYVYASFLDDSTFYAGGQIPSGYGPWTYEAGAGKVVLGRPLQGFTKMKGDNVAAYDIWVNRANGDVHLFLWGSYGSIGYFYKPSGGAWTDTVTILESLGNMTQCRFIDSPDGNLYLIASQSGFKMMTIPKSSITGMIDFSGCSTVPLGVYDGFTNSYAIWPEVKEFQTAPVGGINFAYPGSDRFFPNLLRHTSVKINPGNIALRLSLPNGGEVLDTSKYQTIYWYRNAGAGIDAVSIDFSSNEGSTWAAVIANTPNSGSYRWKVPATASPTCRIRIRNAIGGSPSDTSDANFVIQSVGFVGKPPTATITRPTKDTTVIAGRTMAFEGSGTDSDGYIVNYQWSAGDGVVVKGIIPKSDHVYTNPGIYYATFEVQDNDTLWSRPDTVKVIVTPSTGTGEESTVPFRLRLHPNYPNPFNAGTMFSYSIDRMMQVRIRIFGIRGEEIARLVDGLQSPGEYRVAWDARVPGGQSLASGLYLCRLETPSGNMTQKVLVIR